MLYYRVTEAGIEFRRWHPTPEDLLFPKYREREPEKGDKTLAGFVKVIFAVPVPAPGFHPIPGEGPLIEL